jgi:branched-chain amino acid transport system ATP-binding protein
LDVPRGAIVSILGANGAGKTTTLRAIGGFLRSEAARISGGSVELEGLPVTRKPPHWIAKRGIAIVPERDKVFASLTVQENLASVPTLPGHNREEMYEFVLDLFEPLTGRLSQRAGFLSGGERQMLAVARALLLEPKLLLADELSFGIAPVMVGRLLDALRTVNEQRGTSILLVEQNAAAAFAIASRVYVLENGRVSLEGSPAELETSSEIRRVYFGIDTVDTAS